MSKMPFFQFYPLDWLRDTKGLSAFAKGVWIDILAYAWNEPERGIYSRPKEIMERELGLTRRELENALLELHQTKTADLPRLGNGHVTVMSRRMIREEKDRELTRNRVARYRSNAAVTPVLRESTTDVTPKKLEVRSQKLEVINRKDKNECKRSPFSKPTPENVREYGTAIGFPLDADYFCDYYESRGWQFKNGQPMKDWKAAVRYWKRSGHTTPMTKRPPVAMPRRAPDQDPEITHADLLEMHERTVKAMKRCSSGPECELCRELVENNTAREKLMTALGSMAKIIPKGLD